MVKPNHLRIMQALKHGDATAGQLAAALSMGNTTAWRWLQVMVADGDAFVCGTKLAPHGGPAIAVYRAGKKPDGFVIHAQKPKTRMQIVKKYRKKLRETGDWEDVKARQRAYYWRTREVTRDPLTAAFFGSAQ